MTLDVFIFHSIEETDDVADLKIHDPEHFLRSR
jgi:hypothetical protein